MERFAALLLAALLAFGCGDRELRGTSTPSQDGKTYLVVVDDNGGKCGSLFVDGQEWKFAINEPGAITPGIHTIRCGPSGDTQFEVGAGTTFHFDYWGP